jgi:UDP-N-acetylmuramoylalanine--D-glutamate ligase
MAYELMLINIKELHKIAVVGMGVSGLSAVRLLDFMGKDVYAINQGDPSIWGNNSILNELDEKNKVSQDDALSVLKDCELIILSPGIPRDIDILKDLDIPIWSEIELAYQFLSSEEVMAITGTNGKTTTVSFLAECLEHEGIEHFVGGNIGTPFCDYAFEKLSGKRPKAKIILLELSSFQLESMDGFRPNIAAILNITFSHGERYTNLKDYALAKKHIFDNQKTCDFAFYPQGMWQDLSLDTPTGELCRVMLRYRTRH